MSKITRITSQANNHDRFNIFIDGTYAFSLSALALLENKISLNLEINKTELKQLEKLAENDKVYALALNYAVLRPHSQWEMQTYLKRKTADADLIKSITLKLIANKLIDDEVFAKSWIQNRRQLKSLSKAQLIQELIQKHIPREIIQKALQGDNTSDQQTLQKLILKKQTQSRYKDSQKLLQYLARAGYRYEDIKAALADQQPKH